MLVGVSSLAMKNTIPYARRLAETSPVTSGARVRVLFRARPFHTLNKSKRSREFILSFFATELFMDLFRRTFIQIPGVLNCDHVRYQRCTKRKILVFKIDHSKSHGYPVHPGRCTTEKFLKHCIYADKFNSLIDRTSSVRQAQVAVEGRGWRSWVESSLGIAEDLFLQLAEKPAGAGTVNFPPVGTVPVAELTTWRHPG
ncbi:hypothetical protein J6590_038294 [Homalodisca vitripennis]|nr:hypothetical protein J6590_038294 [Homalodisca vitripennis]